MVLFLREYRVQIVYKAIDELKPYKRNPRNNDGAVDAVAASIKEFGFKVPIVIDTDGEIIAGHTRLKAAQKLGRICYTMEFDPKYCDVIIDRWEKLTGQKAVKI